MMVLDCSAVMALCFEDENGDYAEALLDYFIDNTATAPQVWPLEVTNTLLAAVKRKRLAKAEARHFFHLVSALPVSIDSPHPTLELYSALHELASEYDLSSYDASYLAMAMDLGLPLATLDNQLLNAAGDAGVAIFRTVAGN